MSHLREYEVALVRHVIQCIQQHVAHQPKSSGATFSPAVWVSIAKRVNATLSSALNDLSAAECQAIWRTVAYFELNKIKKARPGEFKTIKISEKYVNVLFLQEI